MVVPHFFQSSPQTCGPACLRMMLAALGQAQDEGTIAQACGVTLYGCQLQDLVPGAQSLGKNAELLRVRGAQDAVAVLSNQVPFVAMIDLATLYNILPMFQWHFVVPLVLA